MRAIRLKMRAHSSKTSIANTKVFYYFKGSQSRIFSFSSSSPAKSPISFCARSRMIKVVFCSKPVQHQRREFGSQKDRGLTGRISYQARCQRCSTGVANLFPRKIKACDRHVLFQAARQRCCIESPISIRERKRYVRVGFCSKLAASAVAPSSHELLKKYRGWSATCSFPS